jgi:phosphoribosylanthranilate isomerase
MFSLRKQIRQIDDASEAQKDLATAYAAMLDAALALPDSPRELFEESRKQIKAMKAAVQPSMPRSVIQEVAAKSTAALQEYAKRIAVFVKRQHTEAREIMSLLSDMAESIGKRDKEHSVRLTNISKKLRLLTTAEDLTEIRYKLAHEVEQLDRSIADLGRDNQAALERLHSSLRKTEPPAAGRNAAARGGVSPRGRYCIGLFLLGEPSDNAQHVLEARCQDGEHIEKLSDREYLVWKSCTLVEMAETIEFFRRELERSGVMNHAGAAEPRRGEDKEAVIQRAREVALGVMS